MARKVALESLLERSNSTVAAVLEPVTKAVAAVPVVVPAAPRKRRAPAQIAAHPQFPAFQPEEEVANILQSKDSLEAKCEQLIAAARAHGGPDNITAVLLQVS